MALTKNWKKTHLDKELVFSDAYIVVSSSGGGKKSLSVSVDVMTKKDGNCIESFIFEAEHKMNGENAIAQGYNHIKTLPEFSGATDC